MQEQKSMPDSAVSGKGTISDSQTVVDDTVTLDGTKLWDEILKAIVSAMPSQLFPLFKEVYGREYSKDTSIVLLGTETSSFWENDKDPPGSTLMDIALLVAGTDYYHLECQMGNDSEMVIRMFAYDVRFAITHSKTMDKDTGEIVLHFPRSVVIYPEENKALPDHLKCRVVFQDNSEHIYIVPTVKIQAYSLEEIKEKHLTMFIPYTILRLRPKLKAGRKHLLTQKELTEFVEEAILVLKEELLKGYLTEREYRYYVQLFRFAADRVLRQHSEMQEEVKHMTEPLIKLSTKEEDEFWDRIEKLKIQITDQENRIKAQKNEIEVQKNEIEVQKNEIEVQKNEIETQKIQLADRDSMLADKDAEILRLQQLVKMLSAG